LIAFFLCSIYKSIDLILLLLFVIIIVIRLNFQNLSPQHLMNFLFHSLLLSY